MIHCEGLKNTKIDMSFWQGLGTAELGPIKSLTVWFYDTAIVSYENHLDGKALFLDCGKQPGPTTINRINTILRCLLHLPYHVKRNKVLGMQLFRDMKDNPDGEALQSGHFIEIDLNGPEPSAREIK